MSQKPLLLVPLENTNNLKEDITLSNDHVNVQIPFCSHHVTIVFYVRIEL